MESVKRKLSLCALFGYLWFGEVPRLGRAAPETAAVLTQEGDHGRWARPRVRGASAELGSTLLHAVMVNVTAGCAAAETWSSASTTPRHLRRGGSSTQRHPHDVTIKGSGGCSASATSAPPRAALVGWHGSSSLPGTLQGAQLNILSSHFKINRGIGVNGALENHSSREKELKCLFSLMFYPLPTTGNVFPGP